MARAVYARWPSPGLATAKAPPAWVDHTSPSDLRRARPLLQSLGEGFRVQTTPLDPSTMNPHRRNSLMASRTVRCRMAFADMRRLISLRVTGPSASPRMRSISCMVDSVGPRPSILGGSGKSALGWDGTDSAISRFETRSDCTQASGYLGGGVGVSACASLCFCPLHAVQEGAVASKRLFEV